MAHRKQSSLTYSERRLLKRILILIAAAAFLWLIFAPGRGYLHYRRVQNQIDMLARENRELVDRNAELRKEIERLQHNEAYLEELARSKYGMLKKNETVYEYKPSSGEK
jgi:cell division protein FtsB